MRYSREAMESNLSSTPRTFVNTLAHAQSTPAGVDGSGISTSKTPPATPRKSGKMLGVRVQMLDDSITVFQVQAKAPGRLLFDQVCKQLNLLEADYFGLEYQDTTTKYWLDFEKPLHRQVGLSLVDPLLRFCVKFYTPDPAQLEEEYTRYLFCLQVKRDLLQGDLQCNDNTAALIISFLVQAECGDYTPEDYPDPSYLSYHKFVPHQNRDLEKKIMENHKKHLGQSPAEADLNLLETARRCELYGMIMHPAKDQENVLLNLAVAHMGIVVFQNCTKINTFSWAKIRKISFKRKKFLIKLHPEGYGYYKVVVEFMFDNRNQCKSFWKKCVENHGFFRCSYVKRIPRQKARVLSRGSSFRYSGKTQKQMVAYVRENYVKRQTFQRSQSFRHQSSTHSSVVNVGASVSAHPLLPLGENNIAGSGASLSCGSMTLSGSLSPTIAQDGGPPTAPIVTVAVGSTTAAHVCLTNTMNMQQTHQTPADTHEPTTTSSDITSIASQSPVHHYDTDEPMKIDDEKLGKESGVKKSSSHVSSNGVYGGNQIVVEVETNIPAYKTNGMLPNSYATKFLSKDEISIESPMPELRNISRISHNNDDLSSDTKKKRPSEKSYFIAKELLCTERTYRKDLEVISFWLRDEFNKEDDDFQNLEAVDRLLSIIDPIYDAHCVLLREIEIRVSSWNPSCVGDILFNFFENLNLYDRYLEEHWKILAEINALYASNGKFETLYREFESQKICYLPLTAFFLKPLQRLLHYGQILDNLLKYYGKKHAYYEDCYQARLLLLNTARPVPDILRKSENLAVLYELSRDISGIDSIYVPDREFIRQGCLSKFSQRKGYQQRMFFLFSDLLLYSARSGHTFRVHGQLPLSNVIIEERPDTPQQHSFSIYGGNRVVTVAASSEEEKDKWLEDLTNAIQKCKIINNHLNGVDNNSLYYYSLKSCNSTDDITEKYEDINRAQAIASQRSNKTVYVCWHRNTSISIDDHLRAVENQLSGFLLRKFKNSNGWQKLWVVFTNFCLFFYKSSQEDFPLAGLPLLGYAITTPTEKDGIQKNYAFKLQFKNHIYYFRAESEYTFNRWMEVIGNATQHSGRHRLFCRKESAHFDPSSIV